MEWLPLKMNFLPLIFQEINFVTEEYLTILNQLRHKEQGTTKEEKSTNIINENDSKINNQNKEKSENNFKNNNKEKETTESDELELIIKKYNDLRQSIGKRINELENFYEENIEDVRVSNFEKARLRLKKLLMYNYETITRVENSSQQKNIFIKKKIIENNISLDKQIIKERIKEEDRIQQKLIGFEEKQKNIGYGKDARSSPKKVIKVRGDEGFLRPTARSRRNLGTKDDNLEKFENDEYSKFKEIVFKIKLNQEEYKTFLKEKKNKGNISPYLFK